MFNYLTNLPNPVLARQRQAQGSHAPVYRRLPRANLYVNTFMATFAVSGGLCLYSMYQLVLGAPEKE